MSKIIIGLTGPIASGKGTVKEYLIKKYNAKDCRFSTMLRDILTRIGESINRENMQILSTSLRRTFGEDIMAKVITKDALGIESDVVVIDGVRRLADISHLSKIPHFKLISIDADPKARYERLVIRNENEGDKDKTYEEFLKDHEYETEQSIPEVMSKADYHIDNNGSIEELHKQIDNLIKKLS